MKKGEYLLKFQLTGNFGLDIFCFFFRHTPLGKALVAQLVEHILGKDEVGGSNPLEGSIREDLLFWRCQKLKIQF